MSEQNMSNMSGSGTGSKAYLEKIRILTEMGRYENAISEVKNALAYALTILDLTYRNYFFDYCYYVYVDILRFQNQLDEAIALAHQGLMQVPDANMIRKALITVYIKTGKKSYLKEIKDLVEFISSQYPNSIESIKYQIQLLEFEQSFDNRKKRHYNQIIMLENKILQLDPNDRDTVVTQTNRLITAGKYKQARDIYERLVISSPNDTVFLDNYAVTLLNTGQRKKATEIFVSVLRLDPNNSFSRDRLKEILANQNSFPLNLILEFITLPFYFGFSLIELLVDNYKRLYHPEIIYRVFSKLSIVFILMLLTSAAQPSTAHVIGFFANYLTFSFYIGRYTKRFSENYIEQKLYKLLNTNS